MEIINLKVKSNSFFFMIFYFIGNVGKFCSSIMNNKNLIKLSLKKIKFVKFDSYYLKNFLSGNNMIKDLDLSNCNLNNFEGFYI